MENAGRQAHARACRSACPWAPVISAAGRALAVLALAVPAPTMADAEDIELPALTTRWWEAFRHPGLAAAIEQGLSTHPDTASAHARIQAAEAGVALARAGRRPEIGVEAGYRWGREQSMETGWAEDDIDPLFGRARLSWELDILGRVDADVDAATARTDQSEADLAGVRLFLSLEIARAYIDVARWNEQADLNREELEDARAIHDRTSRRAEAGLEPEMSRSLALAAWQQAAHRLTQAEIDIDRARARLTSLVGGFPPEKEPASLADFALPPQPELLGEDPSLRRPDVVKAHLAWLEARNVLDASSRARLPSLSLVVSAAADGDTVDDPESWWAWAGPVVSFPVWNPGLTARSDRARSREKAAEAALRAVSLRAVEEIDRAWADRTRSEEMIGYTRTRRTALESVTGTEARKHVAGLIQEDAVRRAHLDTAEAARAELAWRAAALHAHLTLIAALGG